MPRTNILSYIRSQVALPGENFLTQWGALSDGDKATLKQWAEEECDALGLDVMCKKA